MFDHTKSSEDTQAPEDGLPGKVVAGVIIAIVIACMLLSGYGNIQTWTNGLQGIDYWINFGTGIISEIIGAVLLVVIIWSLARPTVPRILVALMFLPVWGMATFQNASASWAYYVEASNAEEEAAAIASAQAKARALQTQAGLATERIEEIKSELSFIGMTRTPQEIRSERDRLPESYRTKRANLTAELNKAERRIQLDGELILQRDTLSKATQEGASSTLAASNSALSSSQASAPNASDPMSVWSFLTFVQTNRLGSLVVVMEMMKSFGLMLINVVFAGKATRASKMARAQKQAASNENNAEPPTRSRRAYRKEAFTPPNPMTLKNNAAARTSTLAIAGAEQSIKEGPHENVVAFEPPAQRVENPTQTPHANAMTPTDKPIATNVERASIESADINPEAPNPSKAPGLTFADEDDTSAEDEKSDQIGIASKFV